MTQKTIKIFINESYSKPPRNNYATNKTDVYHIDHIWPLEMLDLKDYGLEINRGYRYILVIIDNSSKYGWTTPLKSKNAQTIKDSFENINSKEIEIEDFIPTFFQVFQMTIMLNSIQEVAHIVLFLQNALIVLLEIFLKDLSLNEVRPIGLMYYLQ